MGGTRITDRPNNLVLDQDVDGSGGSKAYPLFYIFHFINFSTFVIAGSTPAPVSAGGEGGGGKGGMEGCSNFYIHFIACMMCGVGLGLHRHHHPAKEGGFSLLVVPLVPVDFPPSRFSLKIPL